MGAEQFAMHHPMIMAALGQPAALQMATPENVKRVDQEAKDKAEIDKNLLNTTGGKIGSVVEQAALLAPLGALASPTSVAGLAASGALQGGVGGAVQPVAGDYDSGSMQNILGGAAAGGITAGALGLASKGLQALASPRQTAINLSGYAPKALNPEQQALAEAAQRQGVDLTQGQILGGSAAKLEDAARKSVASADIVKQADNKIIGQWEGSVQKLLDNIYSGDASNAAQRIQGVVKNATSALQKARAEAAAKDYGAIHSLTNGAAVIEPNATNQVLQTLVSDYSGVGTPGADRIAKFAEKQLANVAPIAAPQLNAGEQMIKGMVERAAPADRMGFLDSLAKNSNDPIMPKVVERIKQSLDPSLAMSNPATAPAQGNLNKLMQLRSYLSEVSSGNASISNSNVDKRIATQLLSSIDTDLNSASDSVGGNIGALLKQANARYANFSQKIEGLKNSAAGKLLGEDFMDAMGNGTFNSIPPETVISRLTSMQPSQIEAAKGLIQQTDPEAWQAFKKAAIQGLFDNANSPAKFATATTEGKGITASRLKAMLDPQEFGALQDIGKVSRAIGNQAYANTSGTAGAEETFRFLHALGSAATGNLRPAAGMAASAMSSQQIANMMLNSDAQPILRKLASVGPGTTAFTAYLNQLRGLASDPASNLPAAAGQ
jgi:hypothetical protein